MHEACLQFTKRRRDKSMDALKCVLYALQFVQLASTAETAQTDVVHIVAVGLLQTEFDVSLTDVCLDVMTDGLVTTVIQVHYYIVISLRRFRPTWAYRDRCWVYLVLLCVRRNRLMVVRFLRHKQSFINSYWYLLTLSGIQVAFH